MKVQSSETFLHIWFDENVGENLQIQRALKVLKQNVKNVRLMHDRYKFYQWLIKHHNNENVVLIVSSKCGKQLVPDIHNWQSITAIYVYCTDGTTDNKWTESYSKVRGVISDPNKLAQEVSADTKDLKSIDDFNSQRVLPEVLIHSTELSHVEDILEKKEGSQGGMY